MIVKLILAGFGGQGIILSGKILAYAAMLEGKEVTHFPSYGAEMRGGTCNCSVVISDEPIASPIIHQPDIALAFNLPSKIKYEPVCLPNGILLINSSLIKDKISRADLNAFYIDATHLAEQIGNVKCTNMVMLGALVKISGLVKLESMIHALPNVISAKNKSLLELNGDALHSGYQNVT